MRSYIVFSCLLLSLGTLSAQPNKKISPALSKFLQTEFMLKFRDLRIEAESAAINAQSRKEEIKPADMMRLRSAYDQTASRANNLLSTIKQDFLNAKKLKSIAQFPEMYSDGLRYKLQELSDFYAANFLQVLADTQVKQVDGSAVLLLVVELISLTKGLSDYFSALHRESRQYTELYLQENLVQPYRWRYWDEMLGSVSPYEKFEKSTEMNMQPQPGEDILDRQIQRVSDKVPMLEFKSGSSESDTFDVPTDPQGGENSGFKYENWTPNNDSIQIKQDTLTPVPKGKKMPLPSNAKTNKPTSARGMN